MFLKYNNNKKRNVKGDLSIDFFKSYWIAPGSLGKKENIFTVFAICIHLNINAIITGYKYALLKKIALFIHGLYYLIFCVIELQLLLEKKIQFKDRVEKRSVIYFIVSLFHYFIKIWQNVI